MTKGLRTLLIAGGLALAGLLAYSNSFSVPLILDDWATIQENPRIRQVWPLGQALSPPENTGVGGRPIANLAFVLNYALTGDSLAGYHAGNLLIHLAAALALFGVVRRTLGLAQQDRENVPVSTDLIAAGAAALWLLHPLQTQSVTYLSQRTESLMGCFYLTTLYCFLRSTAAPGRFWPAAAWACCALGMASKEGMVTAPVAVLLLDRWFVSGSLAAAWRRRRWFYVSLAATWLLLPYLMRGLHGRGVGFGFNYSTGQYALIEFEAVTRYLWLGLWPARLVFDYGTEFTPAGPGTFAAAALVIAVAALAVHGYLRRTLIGFLATWFLLTLAPTSSIVPIPLQPIAENRVYLPLAALAVGFAVLAVRTGLRPVLALAAGACGVLTFARNVDYRSEIAIWRDTVAKAPGSSRALLNLGYHHLTHRQFTEALAALEAARVIKPDSAEIHANYASVMGALGRNEEAVTHARRALELDPANATAANNLGAGLMHLGQPAAAEAAFRQAIALRPAFAGARGSLAALLLRQGRAEEALAQAAAALHLKPDLADALFAQGAALLYVGRPKEALPHLENLTGKYPDYRDGPYLTGLALATLGRITDAVPYFEASLRQNPDHAPTHANLGLALARTNRPEAGRLHLETALRLDPNQASVGAALEALRRGQVP